MPLHHIDEERVDFALCAGGWRSSDDTSCRVKRQAGRQYGSSSQGPTIIGNQHSCRAYPLNLKRHCIFAVSNCWERNISSDHLIGGQAQTPTCICKNSVPFAVRDPSETVILRGSLAPGRGILDATDVLVMIPVCGMRRIPGGSVKPGVTEKL
jgi:hypothetical protein